MLFEYGQRYLLSLFATAQESILSEWLDAQLIVVVVNEEMPHEVGSFATLFALPGRRRRLLGLLCRRLAGRRSQQQTSEHRRCLHSTQYIRVFTVRGTTTT